MYSMLKNNSLMVSGKAAGFTSRLISAPSKSLHEEKAAKVAEDEMKELGFDKVFRDGAGNALGILYGRKPDRTILLISHLDTVEPGDEWTDDPFSGRIINKRICGLGASDCKGGTAAQIYAGAILKKSMLPMEGNVVVASVVAEENGLSLGTRFLLNETLPSLNLKPEFAIMGEPTDLGLYYGHNGWLEVDIELESENNFEVALALGAVSEAIGEEELYETDYNPACGKLAVVRSRQKILPGEDPEAVLERIERRAGEAARSAGSVAVNALLKEEKQSFYTGRQASAKYAARAWMTDPFHPKIRRACECLAAAGCSVRPGRWKFGGPGMGTSGSVILNEFSVPVIGYGPGMIDMAHRPGEFLDTDMLTSAVYGTAVMVHGLAGVPVFGWTMDEI